MQILIGLTDCTCIIRLQMLGTVYYQAFKTLNTIMPTNCLLSSLSTYVINFFLMHNFSENQFESSSENSPNAFKII